MKKIISYSLWFQENPINKGCTYQTHNMYYNGLVCNLDILNKKESNFNSVLKEAEKKRKSAQSNYGVY